MRFSIKFYCFLILLLVVGSLHAQKRFRDEVFLKLDSVSSIEYGEAVTVNGHNQKLLLDVFSPSGTDTMKYRPLVIYMHGGQLQDSSKAGGFSAVVCHGFARRGYVVAAIDYRSGVATSGYDNGEVSGSYGAITDAMYRAQQDGRAAVRFFRRYYEKYRIDTSQIFIAGSSFGATACLGVAYMNEDEVPAVVSKNKWGGLEGSGGHAEYSSKVHGVMNIGGTIPDYGWIQPGDAPSFHSSGLVEGPVAYDSLGDYWWVNNSGYFLFERCLELGIATGWRPFAHSGSNIDDNTRRQDSCLRSMAGWLYTQLKYYSTGTEKGEEVFRWEEEIKAFDAQNMVSRYTSGTLLFIGSSPIRLWNTLPDNLKCTRIVNRGFGGCNLRDVAYYIDRIISPFDAKAIFLYVDNDIVGDDTDTSPDQVLELYKYVVKRIRLKFPGVPVIWLATFPVGKSREVHTQIGAANRLIKKFNAKGDALYYLDCRQKFIGKGGRPHAAYFEEGTLHFNEKGYLRWAKLIHKRFSVYFSK